MSRSRVADPGITLKLSDGATVEAERLLVATGRQPNAEGLGLEQLGVSIGPRGVEVDEHLRAAENVWAIGDVSGVALFTHVGKYQARVAAADICGKAAKADYRAIPAGIFTDPEVATVGRTEGDESRLRSLGADVDAAPLDVRAAETGRLRARCSRIRRSACWSAPLQSARRRPNGWGS